VRNLLKLVNFKGELFSSTFAHGLTAIIKLASSLILTRLLNPEAYGVFGILLSVAFMFELMSDVGTIGLMVRHPRGSDPKFIHTLWTIRLLRSCLNFALFYLLAPRIAALYDTPLLEDALRSFSYVFLLGGLQSMSFVIAQRSQQSRLVNYVELITNVVMTLLVIGLAVILRDHYAFIYGILVQRMLMTAASYFYFRDVGVAFAFDREAIAEQFKFARVVLPSSMLTIVLSQYDKVILLKLFDLSVLGVYGLAASMIGPVGGMIVGNCRSVLYPRCADYFRTDPATAAARYYAENRRLLRLGTLLPAAVAGLSQALVGILYDSRYADAGTVLLVMGLATVVAGFEQPAENFLLAAGRTRVILMCNVVRVAVLPAATLLGYHLFGFYGFVWGTLVAPIAVAWYCFWEQRRHGLLDAKAEFARIAEAAGVFAVCLVASRLWVHFVPPGLLQHALHRH
jgi:O-antigen/teichoic acid export membrane protein